MSVSIPCFIELTGPADRPGWVNMSAALQMGADREGGTQIELANGTRISVKESPQEIVRKIVKASVQVEIRT